MNNNVYGPKRSFRFDGKINELDNKSIIRKLGEIIGNKDMISYAENISVSDKYGMTVEFVKTHINDLNNVEYCEEFPKEFNFWMLNKEDGEIFFSDIIAKCNNKGKLIEETSSLAIEAAEQYFSLDIIKLLKKELADELGVVSDSNKFSSLKCSLRKYVFNVISYSVKGKTYELFRMKDIDGYRFGYNDIPGILSNIKICSSEELNVF